MKLISPNNVVLKPDLDHGTEPHTVLDPSASAETSHLSDSNSRPAWLTRIALWFTQLRFSMQT